MRGINLHLCYNPSGAEVLVLWSQFFTGPHGERLAEICDAAGRPMTIFNGRNLPFGGRSVMVKREVLGGSSQDGRIRG